MIQLIRSRHFGVWKSTHSGIRHIDPEIRDLLLYFTKMVQKFVESSALVLSTSLKVAKDSHRSLLFSTIRLETGGPTRQKWYALKSWCRDVDHVTNSNLECRIDLSFSLFVKLLLTNENPLILRIKKRTETYISKSYNLF